jgi:N-methylhydantoinase A
VIKIVNTNMAALLQSMTVKRGYDPRDFALVAIGGAGPLHAASIAQELNIPTVIVPLNSGVFSAWGMLMCDLRHDFALTHIKPLNEAQCEHMNQMYRDLEARLKEIFAQENVREEDITITHQLDLRYLGQEHTLSVIVAGDVCEDDKLTAGHAFDEMHLASYGHNAPEEQKEVVSLRVIGIGKVNKPAIREIGAGQAEPPPGAKSGERPVYRGRGQYESFKIYRRENLLAGNVIAGPAVVEEATATTLVETNQVCAVDKFGNLIITLKQERMP